MLPAAILACLAKVAQAQLLVVGGESCNVVYFDLESNQGQVVAQLEPQSSPRAITQDSKGRIHVGLQFGSRNVVRLGDGVGPTDAPFQSLTPSLVASGPAKIAFDDKGRLFVTSDREASVKGFDGESGQPILEWRMPSPHNLSGLAIGGSYLYAARYIEGSILRFDLDQGLGVVLVRPCPQLNRPISLTVAEDNRLLVVSKAAATRHLIQEFRVDTGDYVGPFLDLTNRAKEPSDIAYHPASRSYFVATEHGVHQFSNKGEFLRDLKHPSLHRPAALYISAMPPPEKLFGYEKAPQGVRELLESLTLSPEDLLRVERLLTELRSEPFAVRMKAARLLIQDPLLNPSALRVLLKEADADFRAWGEFVLSHHQPEQAENMIAGALKIIAEKRFPGLLSAILAALEGRDLSSPEGRQQCRRAVMSTLRSEDIPLLRQALKSETAMVREVAARALIHWLKGEARADIEPLQRDRAPSVKLVAAFYLASLGEPSCLAVFVDALESEDVVERKRAHQALKEITGQEFGYSSDLETTERTEATRRWADWVKEKSATAKLAFDRAANVDLETRESHER